ncbi:twin-arginine translocation signal domain-containing protein [Desulfococcaceae bacterium HSG9]|nr:twin-arginine translocation signal domain-containing protein [Desulfococcaceae bacterium HSG9]
MFDPNKKLHNDVPAEETAPEKKFRTPNRRDFLKGMAVGAGAVALSPIMPGQAKAVDIDVFAMKPSIRGEKVIGGRISHDPRKCAGCRVCEVACAMKNHGEVNPFKSRIKIYTYQPTVFIGVVCQQCGDRPCIEACPVEPDKEGRKALFEHPETKALAVDTERCENCNQCVEACESERNGNLRLNEDETPDGFCLLCGDCVKKCPQNALSLFPRTTDGKYASRNADVMAKEAIESIYGGYKTVMDNFK